MWLPFEESSMETESKKKKKNDSAAEKTDKHSQSGKQGQYQLVNHVNSIYP